MERKELPVGWEWVRLGDAADINMGQSPPGTSYNETGDGTPFLQGNAEFGDTFPEHQKFTTEPSKIASKGSVLISVRAPVGDTNIADLNYCIGRGLAALSLKNGDNKYLLYLLRSMKPLIEAKGTGSTFKAISKSILSEIEIPLPPLPVQRQIVAVLEQAEALKQQRQEADALTGALLQSVFYEMFGDPVRNEKGWDIIQIRDVTSESQYGCSVLGTSNGQYPIMGMNNITYEGRMELTNLKFVDLSEKEFEKFRLEKGDILFNRTNAPNLVGKTGLFQMGENFVFASYLIRLKLKFDLINPEYFWKFLNSPYMKSKFSGMCKKAVNQANINAQELQNVAIPLPPLVLQQQFARIVEEVERIREQQAESGKEIEALCGGLVQRAFEGELSTENV